MRDICPEKRLSQRDFRINEIYRDIQMYVIFSDIPGIWFARMESGLISKFWEISWKTVKNSKNFENFR